MAYTLYYSQNRHSVKRDTFPEILQAVRDIFGTAVFKFKGRRVVGGFQVIGVSKISGEEGVLGFVEEI